MSLFGTFCGGGSRRSLRFTGFLSLLAAVASGVSLGIFEMQSRDEDSGWIDDYGCTDAEIDFLGGLEGRSCFLRGPGYYMQVVAIMFSFFMSVCLCSSAKKVEEVVEVVHTYEPANGKEIMYVSMA